MDHLGKLKRTLNKPCPDCGNKIMQIRIITEEIHCKGEDEEPQELKSKILEEEIKPKTIEKEYLYCPRCEYEERYSGKKSKKYNNQREEEEELWLTSPPIKNYENNFKKKSNQSSTELPKEYRKTWRKG